MVYSPLSVSRVNCSPSPCAEKKVEKSAESSKSMRVPSAAMPPVTNVPGRMPEASAGEPPFISVTYSPLPMDAPTDWGTTW